MNRSKHHSHHDSVGDEPDLARDILWFLHNPEKNERSRPASLHEIAMTGRSDILKVVIVRSSSGYLARWFIFRVEKKK